MEFMTTCVNKLPVSLYRHSYTTRAPQSDAALCLASSDKNTILPIMWPGNTESIDEALSVLLAVLKMNCLVFLAMAFLQSYQSKTHFLTNTFLSCWFFACLFALEIWGLEVIYSNKSKTTAICFWCCNPVDVYLLVNLTIFKMNWIMENCSQYYNLIILLLVISLEMGLLSLLCNYKEFRLRKTLWSVQHVFNGYFFNKINMFYFRQCIFNSRRKTCGLSCETLQDHGSWMCLPK